MSDLEIPIEYWFAFGGLVALLLTLDLFVFHRRAHDPTLRESALWTVFWCSLALVFNGLVWWQWGTEPAVNFLTGYLVEWSLSMDNVFVFVVIFRYFQTPRMYQYRVLFWGILGAVFMRLAFILGSTELLQHFDWIMPAFGAFLIYTAIKLTGEEDADVDPANNFALRLARKVFWVSSGDFRVHGNRFFVREAGRLCITPLFLVLLVIESTDVLFAVDSVPAILGITTERFIVFTSNIFAILGLRALYFLLAGVVDLFRFLNYGLAAVLGFVGLKMIAEYAAKEFWHYEERLIHPAASLAVIVGLLTAAIVASIALRPKTEEPAAVDAEQE